MADELEGSDFTECACCRTLIARKGNLYPRKDGAEVYRCHDCQREKIYGGAIVDVLRSIDRRLEALELMARERKK